MSASKPCDASYIYQALQVQQVISCKLADLVSALPVLGLLPLHLTYAIFALLL